MAGEKLGPSYRRDLRIAYLTHDVSRMRRKAFDLLVKPLGVTRAQWLVIGYLARQDGMMQTQLANVLDTGKASLGTLIDRLESSGWVERRPDPIDGRAKRIYLTRKSSRLLKRLRRVERDFNDQILAPLSGKERDELIDYLSRMKDALTQFGLPTSNADGLDDLV